ncbi:MAG TPA: hypothetical protein VFP72_19065 [Kineosporiaceae bacterium]|nr:hypothetical protein [Kineosporiaceae bacterium]
MDASLDEVLKRVAAGELTPEEALRLIEPEAQPGGVPSAGGDAGRDDGSDDLLHEPGGDGDDTDRSGDRDATGGAPRSGTGGRQSRGDATPPSGNQLAGLRLTVAYRPVTVVTDASVRQVVVTGQHSVREEGGLLVVDGGRMPWPFADPSEQGSWFTFASLPRTMAWARGWPDEHLTIRVNPGLPLEIDATGTSLRLAGIEAGARMRLLACSLKVDRLRGPLDLDARTSSIKGTLGPTGTSRISLEQSSMKVALLPDVSLELSATNRMSKVVLPGTSGKGAGVGETVSTRIGSAAGSLSIDASMSSVVVSTDALVNGR